jgi:hypothetical protein
MIVQHNTPAVVRQTMRVEKHFALGSRKAANRAGRAIRDAIREQIPPGGNRAAGNFEGYAATGTLRRNIVATEPQPRPRAGDWTVTVGLRSGTKADVYARIHRDGGTIRAKNAPYLVFKVKGHWVRVKSVRIRKKNYMADGVRNAQKELPALIRGELAREVRR